MSIKEADKKRTGRISALILAVLLLIPAVTGCAAKETAGDAGADKTQETSVTRDLFAMDTYMTLTAYGENAEAALDAAEAEISYLDAILSTENEDSEIFGLNGSGTADFSEVPAYLLKRSLEANALTDGAFNPLIYPLMTAWGFTDRNYKIPEQKEIDELLSLLDVSKIDFDEDTGKVFFEKEGMKIDFGGIAKGYTSSKVMDIFREKGVNSAVISLGGNVQVLGSKPDGSPWRIAIKDPEEDSAYIGILEAGDKAVITSGGYERYFEQNSRIYHHIIDPDTGYPADSGLISVTIVSSDGTMADALSTAVFVAGRDEGTRLWREDPDRFDMILMTDKKEVYVTEGISDLFSSGLYDVNVITKE